jgi:hypothetical protein
MPGRGLSRGADSGGHCRETKRRSRSRKPPRGAPRGALPSHGRTMSRLASATHSSDPPRRSAAPHSGWRTRREAKARNPRIENAPRERRRLPADAKAMAGLLTCPPTRRAMAGWPAEASAKAGALFDIVKKETMRAGGGPRSHWRQTCSVPARARDEARVIPRDNAWRRGAVFFSPTL